MNEPLILAVDLGTTTCKTLVVDSCLRIVDKESVEYPVHTPGPGLAEQEPEDWWEIVKASIMNVTSRIDSGRIAAIGLSGQMHGLVALDRSGKPLRPAILWNDQRSNPQCAEIYARAGGMEGLSAFTNNPMLPGYTGGKLLWIRENEPHIYGQIDRFCMPKDYIRYRLTGEIATDVSDASGTGLFDVRQRRWASKLLEKLDLPENWFPYSYESGEFTGEIGKQLAAKTGLKPGTPVSAGAGDAVMQTIGGGGINSEVVLLVIGTGGNVTVSLPNPIENPGARLQLFCHALPGQWACMGVTLSAGYSLKWFRDRLGNLEAALAKDLQTSAYVLLGEQVRLSPPGAGGLFFLPYLQGERAPHADPNALAAFIGISSLHEKGDLIRAVMEGVAYSLRDVLDLILQAGISPKRVHVSGGGSASPVWRQILADVFDQEVFTLDFSEDAAAIGAAIVAGVKVGIWSTAQQAAERIETRTVDRPISRNVQTYARYFPIYKNLYPALKTTFDQISSIS